MARFALIKAGKIENVIVASAEFLLRADARWLARYDEVREVAHPGETPTTATAIVTRDAEPGSTWDGVNVARSTAPRERSSQELLEDRIAALEAAKAGR